MPDPLPEDEPAASGTRYRVGQQVRLRPGLEGPDAGLDGRVGTIIGVHRSDPGGVFLSVEVEAGGDAPRQVYVAPAQVDVV